MTWLPRSALVLSGAALVGALVSLASAEEPKSAAADISYNRDIRPILSNRCFKCHGPDQKKGKLDLQNREAALKPLKSGAFAIVPGKSAASVLIERISAEDETEWMPPRGKGERLSAEQIAKLRAWIDQGAKWESHWSYVKPVRHDLPAVKNLSWVKNDVDRFVLARLEKEGLCTSPEADRATLIRRASLDLTGLPPTPKEVDDFRADTSPNAYEKVIDRLLAAPSYGERQALPWLDHARYSDTNGYEKDERRTIWPYRDWVINALNRDMPFDRFTVEQIAGDLLPDATLEQKIATGFHRNTMVNTEGGTDDEEFRVAAVVDRVNTTMEVWMGTTFGCAQCHNHKFDPFTQKEYYQLFAFFNNTADGGRSNEPQLRVSAAGQAARADRLARESAELKKVLDTSTPALEAAQTQWEKDIASKAVKFPDQVRAILKIKPEERSAQEKKDLAKFYRDFSPELVETRKRFDELEKQQKSLKLASTLVMKETTPRPTHVMIRGNHKSKGDSVAPGVPALLHPLREQPANRLALARWLVDVDNPLVGRVLLNRIWAQYFGRGFIETSEDFGAQGEPPTHPELLDWLATELVEQKWSLKALHKEIVMSATYRQSSHVTRALYERDPYNRLLTRGPRFRLPAEMVRDNALAISGLLHRKVGGPSVFPFQPDGVWSNPYSGDKWTTSSNGDQYRRGLYTFWRRTAPYAAFMAFDAPSREVTCERRPRTNTPLQALATLNDRVFVEASQALARRMMTESKGTNREQAVYGFRLCVGRAPTAVEVDHLVKLFEENREKYRQDPSAAKALATGTLAPPPADADLSELAAWTVIANILLNLDEALTKG